MNKVFLYCRKSSESEDRQILSIESQIFELKEIAKRLNLEIVEILTESKSAKAPGRPIFSQMLERLYKGDAQGILCWKLDRLARNPIDGGSIIWGIKNNGIKIFTPSQHYSREDDNTLLMYVEFGMAQKYIDDLGKNVKRGLNMKAEMGWWPQHAPLGYKNTPHYMKGEKKIVNDNTRFEACKRCFKEIINGRNATAVYKDATQKWGLTAHKTGKIIAESTFYKMLNNPFYYGEFEWHEKIYKGKHEPMITRDEFDMVQRMLGKRGKPKQCAQTFDLTGLFRCEQCGCAITATRKVKYYKRTNRMVPYVYYHCTKKKRDIKCTQKPISEAELTRKITEQLLQVQPSQGFIDWAKKWISFLHNHESSFQEDVLQRNRDALNEVDNKMNRLLDLYINDKLTEETYKTKQKELERQKLAFQDKVDNADRESEHWRYKVENTLDFANAIARKFNSPDKEVKHQILIKISSDLLYTSKKPLIQLKKVYDVLRNMNERPYSTDVVARTSKYSDVLVKNVDLRPDDSTWLPVWDFIRTFS